MAKEITMEELRKQSNAPKNAAEYSLMKTIDELEGTNNASQYAPDMSYLYTDENKDNFLEEKEEQLYKQNTMYTFSPSVSTKVKDKKYNPTENPERFQAFIDGEWQQYNPDTMENVYIQPIPGFDQKKEDVEFILDSMRENIASKDTSKAIILAHELKKKGKDITPMSNYQPDNSVKPKTNSDDPGLVHDILASRLENKLINSTPAASLFLDDGIASMLYDNVSDIKNARSRYLPYEWSDADDEFDY